MSSSDAERQELERAIRILGGSTRHARLLEFLGARYLDPKAHAPSEFDIATEVFGRKLESFDPTDDAVVRVEVHRLRKKLRDIYKKEGKSDAPRITLPAGSYLLKFTTGADPAAVSDELPSEPLTATPPKVGGDIPEGHRVTRRVPFWTFASIALVFVAAIAVVLFTTHGPKSEARPAAAQPLDSGDAPKAAAGELTEVHLMAGYSGSETIDSSGVRWTPDRYFVGGAQWSRDNGFVRGTSKSFLFANWRTGEFGYRIPMARGSYELRLYFVSPDDVGNEKMGGFTISLNDQTLLNGYDVAMSANGADVADEQVFRDVTPGPDGLVRLRFTNEVTSPMLNALELVPGTPGKLKPIRILPQPTSFVDRNGQRWRADDYYQGGFRSTMRVKVEGTDDPELFVTERYGRFRYAIPVDRRGRYTVILHFAEFYYGPQSRGGGGAGHRIFHVFCNGQTLLRNFDIFKEVGGLRVLTKTFSNIEPSAQGKINLDFEPVLNNATVSGIEVLDESN
jgi:hypothetical protein